MESRNLVIVDKDETIVGRDLVVYDGVRNFLLKQLEVGRDLVLATLADTRPAKVDMLRNELEQCFSLILGADLLNTTCNWREISDGNGNWCFDCLPDWQVGIWQADGKQVKRYENCDRNPQLQALFRKPKLDKDIGIVRRLYASSEQLTIDEVNGVFIGNEQDAIFADTDPEIPLLVVSEGGGWINDAELVTDTLFAGKQATWQTFDSMYAQGNALADSSVGWIGLDLQTPIKVLRLNCRQVRLEEQDFILATAVEICGTESNQARLIYPS